MDHIDAAYDHWEGSEDDQFMSSSANKVVMRHPRSARCLLEDCGNGAEADLLGTTPPRSRKRGKNRTRTMIDRNGEQRGPTSDPKRLSLPEQSPDWRGRRSGIKVIRNKERDFKQSQAQPEGPALVEMCNRFKSLWSWPKCRETEGAEPRDAGARGGGHGGDGGEEGGGDEGGEDVPEVRVNFHKTFSMLINMGNADKNCRRTISREEQVWQSELKDLIWLELQARIAGRSLPQQDAVLCAQRGVVPDLVHDILHYRFVNPNPCGGAKPCAGAPADAANDNESFGCLSFTCHACNDAISKALAEVGSLLDSFYSATTLYPSSRAMTLEHKQLATERFENRLKAMCLWYNLALHMRLMLAGVSRLLRSVRPKERRATPAATAAPATPAVQEHHQAAEQSSDGVRQNRVRFDCNSNNPADCSNDPNDCSNNPADCSNNPADCSENRADCSENRADCSRNRADCSNNPADCSNNPAGCSNNPADCSNNPADCSENRADCSENRADCSRNRADCSNNPADCSNNPAGCSNNPADCSNNPADCSENRADCNDNPTDCSNNPTESSINPSGTGHGDFGTHLDAKEFNSTPRKSIEDEQENEVEQNYVDKNAAIESGGDDGSRSVAEEKGRHSNEEEKSETVEVGDEADKVLLGQDYTDGSSRKSELSDLPTPEIVLSGSQYSTSETIASNESGYSSMRAGAAMGAGWRAAVGAWAGVGGDEAGGWELGALQELAALRLLGRCQVSPYRPYHFEKLKTQGVRRSMIFIQKMRRHLLDKVYLTFDNTAPSESEPKAEECRDHSEVFHGSPAEEEKREPGAEGHISEEEANELRRFGFNSAECRAMRLPSYRNHFLLLSSICMEAVHDYLALRLEGRPEEPSCLTVKQLIHELKEGLDIATDVRAVFVRNVAASLRGGGAAGGARTDLLLLIRTFDDTVETVLKQYLSYLRTMSSTEHMGRACLEAEWAFTARLARRVRCAALLAPACFTDIACNQLNRIEKQFKCKFEELDKKTGEEEAEYSKYAVYAVCRAAQSVYACERDATLHAAQWARTLAARLQRAPQPTQCHLRARIFESLMSIRDCIVRNCAQIMGRSRLAEDEARELGELVGVRVRELLLQIYKLAFELHKVLYEFAQAPFKAAADGWGRQRPMSLQPPRPQGAAHRRRRPETMVVNESFNPMIHKELHRFVNSSRQPGGGGGGGAGGESGRPSRPRYLPSLSACDDLDGADRLLELATQGDAQNAFLSEAPPPGPEAAGEDPCEEARAEVERAWAARAARAVIELARCWMQFVMERCDRGRGLRPRWASQGLEFLMLACDPCNTKHLSNEEFEELKHLMDECISHVIGSRPPAPRAPDPTPAPPAPPPRARPRPGAGAGAGAGREREPLTPPPPPSDTDPLVNHHADTAASHSARVVAATRRLDAAREQKLLSLRAIGRVREAAVAPFEPRLRQVTFKWQRGLKIGAGTFGKVYTVVNTETGQLLAMKELSVGVGDRRALQRAANELQLLEGVIHPHLVRYYGCEVHRDEMLIFMELCVEGSLEALVAGTGALAEGAVRRYTRQLLSAVHALHQRSIVHRDIKSGNVFLTNDGHCLKLGDFGCAVKIRANTTAVGELQGYVGTQAYMAPEVFMKSSGHGRAADIWSLGCVVTEMASGKRPFAEYDSNYQIMFVVGMGGRPAIPGTLSAEGADFCARCLTHDPELRPRADALAMHTFLMLQSDEDCKCEPGRLLGNTEQCSRERNSEV